VEAYFFHRDYLFAVFFREGKLKILLLLFSAEKKRQPLGGNAASA